MDRHVDVALERCPGCGATLDLATDEAIEQTIVEILPAAPEIVCLTTHCDRCRGCGLRAASSHPLPVSTARGAASTHLASRALALAAALNKGLGLTTRKTCAVLRDLAGLEITPGGLSQALARIAGLLAP